MLNHRIRTISGNGVVETIMGTDEAGFSFDGARALDSSIGTVTGLSFDLGFRPEISTPPQSLV